MGISVSNKYNVSTDLWNIDLLEHIYLANLCFANLYLKNLRWIQIVNSNPKNSIFVLFWNSSSISVLRNLWTNTIWITEQVRQ